MPTLAREPLLGAYAKDPFGRAESVDIHAALRSHTEKRAIEL